MKGDEGKDVEITPEMIEAGVAIIRQLEYEFWEARTPEAKIIFVTAIFKEMLASSNYRCGNTV